MESLGSKNGLRKIYILSSWSSIWVEHVVRKAYIHDQICVIQIRYGQF